MSEFEKAELRIKYTRLISYLIVAATIVMTGFHMINVANKMYYDMKQAITSIEYRVDRLEKTK